MKFSRIMIPARRLIQADLEQQKAGLERQLRVWQEQPPRTGDDGLTDWIPSIQSEIEDVDYDLATLKFAH